jgi:hypothetical protein
MHIVSWLLFAGVVSVFYLPKLREKKAPKKSEKELFSFNLSAVLNDSFG